MNTSASLLMSGATQPPALSVIPMIQNASRLYGTVPCRVALLLKSKSGCAKVMETIVGFWLGTTPCSTTRGKCYVGTLRVSISTTANEMSAAVRSDFSAAAERFLAVPLSPAGCVRANRAPFATPLTLLLRAVVLRSSAYTQLHLRARNEPRPLMFS